MTHPTLREQFEAWWSDLIRLSGPEAGKDVAWAAWQDAYALALERAVEAAIVAAGTAHTLSWPEVEPMRDRIIAAIEVLKEQK